MSRSSIYCNGYSPIFGRCTLARGHRNRGHVVRHLSVNLISWTTFEIDNSNGAKRPIQER